MTLHDDIYDEVVNGEATEMHLDAEPQSERTASKQRPRIEFLEPDALTRPLPPLEYLWPTLKIAEGAATLLAGYGYSKKTMCAQAMALSVSTGADLFGLYTCKRQGTVVHFDFEQGDRLTIERYQRLARGVNVELDSSRLRIACYPRVRLNDKGAERAYADAIGDAALVIVDSLRASVPGVDENSSEVREFIDMLSRICAPVRAVPLVIHHAKKPKSDDPNGARFSIRGSGAIFDACASVFVLSGKTNAPTLVEHEKERNTGITLDPFYLDAQDVELAGDGRAGLRIVHLDREQVVGTQGNPHHATMEQVVAHLAEQGGSFEGPKSALIATLRVRRQDGYAALGELQSSNRIIIEEVSRGKTTIRLP